MNKKMAVGFLVALIAIVTGVWLYMNSKTPDNIDTRPSPIVFDPLNASYSIDGVPVTLKNGKSPSGLISIFGEPTVGEITNDGANDAAFILTRDTSGSGTFFYIVAARNTSSGAQGTNAILLGDRIAPQTVEIRNKQILVNYADRKPGEPMTATPSVGVSMYLALDGTELKKVVAPAQSLTYLMSSEEPTKYCNGSDMDSAGYEKTITVPVTTTTPSNLSQIDTIKFVLNASTSGMCRTALNQVNVSVIDGVVQIPPIDAWAGVSITMCSCRPQVEVNMLRIPGITRVSWSGK